MLPRLLVTGGTGLLGSAVLVAARDACAVVATHHRAPPPGDGNEWIPLDLEVDATVDEAIARARPDVVLHAAVSNDPADLDAVVVRGSERVARAARRTGAALVHVSSDMVFDGASGPFAEESPPSPITDYGRAKAEAERLVRAADPGATIVRCSLLYRLDPPDRSLARWLGENYPLFTDEVRCPAHVDDVARALVALALRRAAGADLPPVFHAVGPEAIARAHFGALLLEALGRDPALVRTARSADAGLVRPRELVLTTAGTPSWFTAFLRAPRDVLG